MNQNLKWYESKRGVNQQRSGNRLYNHKKIKLNEYKCSNAKCVASIFLIMVVLLGGQNVIADPLQIHRYNDKHAAKSIQINFLSIMSSYLRLKVWDTQIHHEWEKNRVKYKERNPTSNIVLPEFCSVINICINNTLKIILKFYN